MVSEASLKRKAPEGHMYEAEYNKYKEDRAAFGFKPVDFDIWVYWNKLWGGEYEEEAKEEA